MLSAVPSSGRVNTMIRITGIGDHDRLEWLIRINGMRNVARMVEEVAFDTLGAGVNVEQATLPYLLRSDVKDLLDVW
jgi:hypothetical protein